MSRHPGGHRMKWFVWSGGQRMRHTAKMIGTWGWDVECECGWKTNTGGATRTFIRNEVWFHHFETEEMGK